jgi:hypothetical protein
VKGSLVNSVPEPFPIRKQVLDRAAKAVLEERNKIYGEPDEDFARIAELWNALGVRIGPEANRMQGHHVSMLMVAFKLSRLTWSPTHEDSWIDVAGYAACGLETATLEQERDGHER